MRETTVLSGQRPDMTVSDENFSNSFRLFHFRHFINCKLAKFGDEKALNSTPIG
jgi:hypothetical protein